MRRWIPWSLGVLLGTTQMAWAASGTTLDGAVAPFQALVFVALFLMGVGGLGGIIYSVIQNSYGVIWDRALGLLFAAAVGASASVMLGWVGSAAGSELPAPSGYEMVLPPTTEEATP